MTMDTQTRRWLLVVAASLGLAVVSLLSNLTADKISSVVVGTLLLLAGLVMTVGALGHRRERLEAS